MDIRGFIMVRVMIPGGGLCGSTATIAGVAGHLNEVSGVEEHRRTAH